MLMNKNALTALKYLKYRRYLIIHQGGQIDFRLLRMELESIQFQLRDSVNEVMTLLAPSAHDKQLELSIYINPQVPDHLTGDPTRFKQVLINLLSNAIKFTEKGAIKVDTVVNLNSHAS